MTFHNAVNNSVLCKMCFKIPTGNGILTVKNKIRVKKDNGLIAEIKYNVWKLDTIRCYIKMKIY